MKLLIFLLTQTRCCLNLEISCIKLDYLMVSIQIHLELSQLNFPIVIKFNKEELLKSVERVSLLSPRDKENNYNIIKLNVRPDYIVEISSTNNEIGDALEEIIPTGDVVGPMIKIAFSSKYLTEALKAFTSTEITLNFAGEIKPFVLKGELDPDMLHLILPVRIE